MTEQNANREVIINRLRAELALGNSGANDALEFQTLEPGQQAALTDWIRSGLVPAKGAFRRNSCGMKHDFAKEPDGFYIRNGSFKGAMLAVGFPPVDEHELNWRFRVKPAQIRARWEMRETRRFGRGLLIRDRWREKGYTILIPTQLKRIAEHNRQCQEEQLPFIVVLKARYTAKIMLDTSPAGYHLTRDAVASIEAVFAEFDPKGRRSSVSQHLAVIGSVPLHRVEAVATELVRIVNCPVKLISWPE
jgi:hypothetical protein